LPDTQLAPNIPHRYYEGMYGVPSLEHRVPPICRFTIVKVMS